MALFKNDKKDKTEQQTQTVDTEVKEKDIPRMDDDRPEDNTQEDRREVAARPTPPLPAGDDATNPFEEVGRQAARVIVGQLLKFSKGDYLYGQDNIEMPMNSRLIANMDQTLRGWVRWEENKPAEHVMGLIAEGYKPPKRELLEWHDESEWETDDKGQPRDPWQETYYMLSREIGKDGKPLLNDEGLFTFTTSSVGGKDAIIALCGVYGKWMRMHPNEYPIITLSMEKYNHPNKAYGVIKKPKFLFNPRRDWIKKSEFGVIEAAPDPSEGEELPF
jgi:hypothetical protein